MKTVKEILSVKPFHFSSSLPPDSKVIDAITLMKIESLDYVIVMENNKYLGIVTDHDYTQKIVLGGKDPESTCVSEIMNSHVPVVDVEDSMDTCRELMHAFRLFYLPVFEEFSFKGVITLNDLLTDYVEEHIGRNNQESSYKNSLNRNSSLSHHHWK
jgi:predicted transcriptional regulator